MKRLLVAMMLLPALTAQAWECKDENDVSRVCLIERVAKDEVCPPQTFKEFYAQTVCWEEKRSDIEALIVKVTGRMREDERQAETLRRKTARTCAELGRKKAADVTLLEKGFYEKNCR